MTVLPATHTISEFSIEEIGRAAGGRITAKILGFWGSDLITLYIDRKLQWTLNKVDPKWVAKMSHSSGGRDTKEVPCDLAAELNFAAAMQALVYLGHDIINQYSDTMEKEFQAERVKQKALLAEETAAQIEKLLADPEIGIIEAKQKIAILAKTGTAFFANVRASNNKVVFSVQQRDKTRFYLSGIPVSRKAAEDKLATLSAKVPV